MIYEKSITLKQLRSLAAIMEAGNLSQAADLLGITTPAVSTQLRNLEDNFGVELLERGPNGSAGLTPAGEAVLGATTEIETALRHCFKRVQSIKAGKEGHVILGVVSTGKYYAPGLVKLIRTELPDIDLELVVGNRSEIIEKLAGKEIDIAIMGRPPRQPIVEADEIGPHPHLLIVPPGHHLLQRTTIEPVELLKETFLCRESGSGTRILTERYLDRIGEGRPYERIELGSNETIKQAVIAGLGIALISAHTVIAELETGRLETIDMEGLPIIRRWFLVHTEDRQMTPAVLMCRDFIMGLNGSFLPHL